MVTRCLILTLWALLMLQEVTARTRFKRDTPLSRVNIPLTLNSDRHYVVGVDMSSSPEKQSFRFAVSGNTGYVAVAGSGCAGCERVPTYDASASASQSSFSGSASISIGSASISGSFLKENCSFHTDSDTPWQYPNQTIVVANSSSSLFSDVTSGLAGLGTNANGRSGDFFDTIYGGWLARNPSRDNFTFGMDLKPPRFTSDSDVGNGGVIHWVVPDSSAHQSTVTWNTASVSANVPSDSRNTTSGLAVPESDWSIQMDGWSASVSGTALTNTTTAQALIEPFFPDVYFPASQANLLYAAVPSAVRVESFVSGAQAWSIPCDSTLSVAFSFSGQAFPLDQSQLVERQGDGSCIGTIKAWPDDSVNDFLLGSNFISSVYLIYVVGRPGSDVSNSIGMALRDAASSGAPVGAIVGGTIGGVVFVALLVAGAFFLGRRQRQKKSQSGNNTSEKTLEKEVFMTGHGNVEGSDEDGAQYANYSLTNYGPHNNSPRTPLTGDSTQPLLNPHEPRSPELAVNNNTTPHSNRVSNPGSIVSQVSYNPYALGANTAAVGASNRASVPYGTVNPYVVPSGSGSATTTIALVREQKALLNNAGSRPTSQDGIQQQFSQAPNSPQDIDPLAPSTASASASSSSAPVNHQQQQRQPFILAPAPQSAQLRANAGANTDTEDPAPPYTAQPTYPGSPTLVAPSQGSASTQLRPEKS